MMTPEMTPEEKRPYIHRLFTRIAPRYDWFNRIASCGMDQRWRRIAVQRAEVSAGHRVLDVCTGTGDLAILCARRQGTVMGADLTAEMLRYARRKQEAAELSIGWCQADAEALPFAAAQFDAVLIGFSTRNLSHLDRGIAEMLRVLKPRGKLVMLETGRPAHPVLRAGYHAFLVTVAPLIGLLLTGKLWPFTYLARSVKAFLTPQQMIAQLQRAATAVEYVPLSCGLASLFVATKMSVSPSRLSTSDQRVPLTVSDHVPTPTIPQR